jgi:hypothetical protein
LSVALSMFDIYLTSGRVCAIATPDGKLD